MAYTTVIFDMDGTILDTLEDLKDAVNVMLDREGLPPVTLEKTRQCVGSGALVLMERILGRDYPRFQEAYTFFRGYYAEHSQVKTGPYPGILPLMAALRERGVTMAVVSNKPHEAVVPLSRLFFGENMALSMGERPGLRRKPSPDMVWAALKELGKDREECLYVGDSEVDIQTAQNAGLPCVAVSWGFRDREVLEELSPMAVIDSPMELLELL